MSSFSTSRDHLLASLQHYKEVLEAKNAALADFELTSRKMKYTLDTSNDTNTLDVILDEREKQCKQLSKVFSHQNLDANSLLKLARDASSNSNDELNRLAQNLLCLQADSQHMAQSILKYQTECESILKERLRATGSAIKQSVKRRKLDAAYGPANSHESPVYLDKQR